MRNLGDFCDDPLFERRKRVVCESSQSSKLTTVLSQPKNSLFILSLFIPLFISILTFIFILPAMHVFVNLFARAGNFSVKDTKSNSRRCSLTDGSHHGSFHLDFLCKEGRKEGRSVFPTRSLQLLVGNTFPILWVISNVFSISHFTLLHPEETFKIPAVQGLSKCRLFQDDSTLLVSPYRVHSAVSLSIFREFLSALDGNAIKITETNYIELERWCDEFGFFELAAKLSEFGSSMDFQKERIEDADARGRIAVLEEKANQDSHVIAMLQNKVTQLSTDFGRLAGEVSALRSAAMSLTVTPSQNQPPPPSSAVPQPSQSITSTPCQKQMSVPSPAAS
jgi:hypothetical protein